MPINIDNDQSSLQTGSWTPELEGVQFLVSHMSSPVFQRAVLRIQQPHRKKIDRGTIDPALSRKLVIEAMAEALIHDWKGDVVDKDGKKVPYSKEACIKVLSNNEDTRDFISEYAMNLDNYREERKAELVKS